MTLLRDIQHETVMEHITPVRSKPKPAPKPKKPNNPKIDKAAILAKRKDGWWKCCDCGCFKNGHDLHHAFIGRKKGYPILDDERNLVLVNHDEHIARTFDTQRWRKRFWMVQTARYGLPAMLEWIDAVLAAGLDRSRIDWL